MYVIITSHATTEHLCFQETLPAVIETIEDGVQITEGGVYATNTLSIKPLAQFYVTKR